MRDDRGSCIQVFEQQHIIKCSGFIVKINLNNIYFLPQVYKIPYRRARAWPSGKVSCIQIDQTYLLTPRLLQTSHMNALILESRSIIISSFNFKEL